MRDAIDLSPEAVARRQRSQRRGRGHGGATGRELTKTADEILQAALGLRKRAGTVDNRVERAKLIRRAQEGVLTAATQIRIAQRCPVDGGYLHHLTLTQIQECEREARAVIREDRAPYWGALAVDTHRRIAEQRERARAGG